MKQLNNQPTYWSMQIKCTKENLNELVNLLFGTDQTETNETVIKTKNRMKEMDKDGNLFANDLIEQVWEQARPVEGYPPSIMRQDKCGAWIKKNRYGDRELPLSFGWVINYIVPPGQGGTNDILNLQALQWENNESKANNYPSWECKVSMEGTKNRYM